jgi:hypothetical protein
MVTKDVTFTCEINSRIAMVKAEFNNKRGPCSPENLGFNIRRKL